MKQHLAPPAAERRNALSCCFRRSYMPGGFAALPLAEASRATAGSSRILGPTRARFPILTMGLLAIQLLWAVEMSHAPPYLLSLGLAKSNMAIVFAAGPLSGFLVQPLIGILADNSTSRWGRRRPYMLTGCVLCAAGMLLLGFTREFAAIFTGWNNPFNNTLTVWLAILSIYLVDFSVNAVQAMDRALLVDTLPPSMQASANAWAARMLGVGGILGFFVGNLDLPTYLPLLGSTELQVLSVMVAGLLLFAHLTTAMLVKEKTLIRPPDHAQPSLYRELRQLFSSMFSLPRIIQQICAIQFFAWLGWFPVLFYTTMYISDLYARSQAAGANTTEIAAEGTRLGSRALFFSAVLSLSTNLVLPSFVRLSPLESNQRNADAKPSHWIEIPEGLKIPLSTLWAWSHLLFGMCMLGTFLVTSVDGATFMIALTGIPWAITQWAPFSLLGEAILTTNHTTAPEAHEDSDEIKMEDRMALNESSEPNLSSQAGVILGIHNIYVVIPQFLVTILCAVVFAIFDGDTAMDRNASTANSERPNSVVYIFRLGAVWSFVAFRLCRRLGRELGR
ncbi:major facilitator superfamily domain-containing protein [Mycena amicta]|nr:major facilitator superfamily domain-containing protein [Mycena amicta]